MSPYINLKYKPKETEVLCLYKVTPAKGVSLEEAAENLAKESSIGTWTKISTMNPKIARTLKPTIYRIDKKMKEVEIAYPADLFEEGNMPEILSSIAGNIFGMKVIDKLKFQDVVFPKKIIKSFKGPKFGIKGIRKLTKIYGRPLIGTIVKPKVGLNEKQHARVAYEAWMGGLDVVKDDENLSSMRFNKFDKRMKETFKLRDKAEKETGEKKIYMPNISAETNEMLRRAKIVKKFGGEYIMVDILTTGFSALQTIRNANLGLVIHAHRAMHAALDRMPDHGVSMMVIAKVMRLIGMDQLHIGTANIGKMAEVGNEGKFIEEAIEKDEIKANKNAGVLHQKWYGLNSTLAVASGGLHPGMTPKLIKAMGIDIVAQFGGGCHGHPDGTRSGAKAIRQATEAAIKNIPLKEYAKDHEEIKKAIKIWGEDAKKDNE